MAENRRDFIRLALLTGALALALGLVASSLYYNPRPFMVTGEPSLFTVPARNGFPSGHALLTSSIAAIVTVFSPLVGGFLWLIALLVSTARVLAGVHHALDVVASFAIAAVSAAIVRTSLRR